MGILWWSGTFPLSSGHMCMNLVVTNFIQSLITTFDELTA